MAVHVLFVGKHLVWVVICHKFAFMQHQYLIHSFSYFFDVVVYHNNSLARLVQLAHQPEYLVTAKGSNWEVDSSKMMTRGCNAKIHATARRCCWPPDKR